MITSNQWLKEEKSLNKDKQFDKILKSKHFQKSLDRDIDFTSGSALYNINKSNSIGRFEAIDHIPSEKVLRKDMNSIK